MPGNFKVELTTLLGSQISCVLELLCICCGRVWQFLRKLNIELPYDPASPLLELKSKKKLKWGFKHILVY